MRGVDLSADMLALSKARCAAQPWVEFEIADAAGLPYPDAAFDAAVSTQVYEYVPDIPAALAELRALGAKGEYFFSLNRYLFLAAKPRRHTPGYRAASRHVARVSARARMSAK